MDNTFAMCTIDNIPTIKQDTYYYCAAACLKMCLGEEKSQGEIFKELKELTHDKENWYAEPDAVYRYLKNSVPCVRLSEDKVTSLEATEKILSCVASTKMSAPMLVSKGKHWVLYSGYQMDEQGNAKGIYIRDPWPTTASLTFYPFCDFFFNDYFAAIDVEGKMKGKIESFISQKTIDCIKINEIKKPQYGGISSTEDVLAFKKDIIKEDLLNYGFDEFNFIKSGGAQLEDVMVYDSKTKNPKYLLTYLEINNALSIAALDVQSHSVIAIVKATDKHYTLFNNDIIAKELGKRYNKKVDDDNIKLVYDSNQSTSCFDPSIEVDGVGRFNLLLDSIS